MAIIDDFKSIRRRALEISRHALGDDKPQPFEPFPEEDLSCGQQAASPPMPCTAPAPQAPDYPIPPGITRRKS
jgi:hypothetical protein